MNKPENPLESIQAIKQLMERSVKFISLSGLSGVFAGICALIGAGAVYVFLPINPLSPDFSPALHQANGQWNWGAIYFLVADALAVLLFSLCGGIYFTARQAQRKGQKIWDKSALLLLENIAIPLIAGGFFCLMLVYHRQVDWVAPSMLIFYGLALLNGSKYTFSQIKYLGLTEVGLGLMATFFLGYGLWFWALGFGIAHILYGAVMYWKYEAP
jgi:hypothetical protein